MIGEENRVQESRAQKRKAMQEIADRASAEGRELSIDEWYRIAEEQIGTSGILFGDAPTSSVMESMRQSSNAKAEETTRQRTYDKSIKDDELTNRMRGKAEELYRSDPTADIDKVREVLEKQYPGNSTKMTSAIWGGIGQGVDQKDFLNGITEGKASFRTDEQAKDYINSAGIKGRRADGIMSATRSNFQDDERYIIDAASKVGGMIDPTNTVELEKAAKFLLPSHMQTPENIMRLQKAATGFGQFRKQNDRLTEDHGERTAWGSFAPQAANNSGAFDIKEAEKIQAASTAASNGALQEHQLSVQGHMKDMAGVLDPKSKAPPAAKALAGKMIELVNQFDIAPRDAVNLRNAVMSGDEEAYDRIAKYAQATSRPVRDIVSAKSQAARMAAGDLRGDPESMFASVASIDSTGTARMLNARGLELAKLQKRGDQANARMEYLDSVNKMAEAMVKTREVLQSSGKFSGDESTIAPLDRKFIEGMAQHLSQSSGIPMEKIVADVWAKRTPAQTIYAKPGDGNIYRAAVSPGLASNDATPPMTGSPYPSGVGAGYPQPAPMQPASQAGIPGLEQLMASLPPGPERNRIMQMATELSNAGSSRAAPAAMPGAPQGQAQPYPTAQAKMPFRTPGQLRDPAIYKTMSVQELEAHAMAGGSMAILELRARQESAQALAQSQRTSQSRNNPANFYR
jgi:hypothetical protein